MSTAIIILTIVNAITVICLTTAAFITGYKFGVKNNNNTNNNNKVKKQPVKEKPIIIKTKKINNNNN